MNKYSAKQIKTWESSMVTYYLDGYLQGTYKLGERLLSLFIEGFARSKDVNGHMCVYDANGFELEIHSASLAKALRKLLKEHKKNLLNSSIRAEMKSALQASGQYDRAAAFDLSGTIGCNADDKTARAEYILFGNGATKYVFARHSWNAALELVYIKK